MNRNNGVAGREGNWPRIQNTGRIWIDLENSPHVLMFKPIIEELKCRGIEVFLTARDCFQVCGLADLMKLDYIRVGHHYGKNKLLKTMGLMTRTLQLTPLALRKKPHLALSHGSRSQVLTAALLRIPCTVMVDYEHTTWLPFINPSVVIPDVIPEDEIRRKAPAASIYTYHGIKEDIYVPTFTPNPKSLFDLGIYEENQVVTIRPPATEAHYHNPESEQLFFEAVKFVGRHHGVRMVVLPRTEAQAELVRKTWPDWCNDGKIIIPEHAINGLDLIWRSDLVISGGGTMNREAAALGVPVYSIFRGKTGAVDKYLAESNRLVLLESVSDIRTRLVIVKRKRHIDNNGTNPDLLMKLVDHITGSLPH